MLSVQTRGFVSCLKRLGGMSDLRELVSLIRGWSKVCNEYEKIMLDETSRKTPIEPMSFNEFVESLSDEFEVKKLKPEPPKNDMSAYLREYYAGLAMQGMLAAGNKYADTDEEFVRYAIGFADALIRELQKDQS